MLTPPRATPCSVRGAQFNNDGAHLLTGSYDFSTVVWDVKSGAPKQRFEVHTGQVLDVDWQDSNTFTSCSSDNTIAVCQVNPPSISISLSLSGNLSLPCADRAHAGPARVLPLGRLASTAVSVTTQLLLRCLIPVALQQVGAAAPVRTFLGHRDEVNAVKWDPAGRMLASCSDDTTVKLWQLDKPSPVHDLREHKKEIYTIRWSPTGPGSENPNGKTLLASASFDASVKLWDAEAGKATLSLDKHDKKVYTVAFSPCGSYLASGSLGGQLYIWDVKGGSVVKCFRGGSDIFEVAWNQNGTRLACCGATGSNNVTIIDFRV